MRRNLSKGLARAARQAALVSTLGLALALAVGVGGFFVTAAGGASDAAVAAAATPPATPPDVTPDALAAVPRRPAPEQVTTMRALTVIPVRQEAPVAAAASPTAPAAPAVAAGSAGSAGSVSAAAFSGPVASVEAAAPATPPLAPGDRINVTVSFYYCEAGTTTAATGDGGGFCGVMRDGSVVYNGAAACDIASLGERFKILGDPLDRIYRCADTGSAVHGLHRDIWFHSSDAGWAWLRSVGQVVTIEILP